MKQRGSFSINTLILSAVASAQDDGITRTRLTQEIIMNYSRIGHYLADLASKDLVSYDAATRRYRITTKGTECLRLSEELAYYISPVRGMISKYEMFFSPIDDKSYPDIESILLGNSAARQQSIQGNR